MNWLRQLLLPLAILIAGLCVTGVAWQHERDASMKELRGQFDF